MKGQYKQGNEFGRCGAEKKQGLASLKEFLQGLVGGTWRIYLSLVGGGKKQELGN